MLINRLHSKTGSAKVFSSFVLRMGVFKEKGRERPVTALPAFDMTSTITDFQWRESHSLRTVPSQLRGEHRFVLHVQIISGAPRRPRALQRSLGVEPHHVPPLIISTTMGFPQV